MITWMQFSENIQYVWLLVLCQVFRVHVSNEQNDKIKLFQNIFKFRNGSFEALHEI